MTPRAAVGMGIPMGISMRVSDGIGSVINLCGLMAGFLCIFF